MPGFPAPSPVGEIFRFFLRLGLTAFGGPAAHLALMQQESVSPDSLLLLRRSVPHLKKFPRPLKFCRRTTDKDEGKSVDPIPRPAAQPVRAVTVFWPKKGILMSTFAISSLLPPNVEQSTATARTGPAQPQQSDPTPDPTSTTPQDTVKLSATAQAVQLYQSGDSVSAISADLGISTSLVDSYLSITPSTSAPLSIGSGSHAAAPAAAASTTATAATPAAATTATAAKVSVKA